MSGDEGCTDVDDLSRRHDALATLWDHARRPPTLDPRRISYGRLHVNVFELPVRERLDRLPRARAALDLGCGWGRDLVYLAQQGRIESGVGVDVSPGAIEGATALAAALGTSGKHIAFRRAGMEDIGADEKFDLVLSISSLNYVEDLARLFGQLGERCDPGAHVLIGERRRSDGAVSRAKALVKQRLGLATGGTELLVARDVDEVVAAARPFGFDVVRVDHAGLALNRLLARPLFALWKRRWTSELGLRLARAAYGVVAAVVRAEDQWRSRSTRGLYWFVLLQRTSGPSGSVEQ